MTKRNAGELGLAPRDCICDPMDLAALGHMMNCPAYWGIGDAVEVKVAVRPKLLTVLAMRPPPPREQQPIEQWLPATICAFSLHGGIAVAFSDGERLALSWSQVTDTVRKPLTSDRNSV